MTTETMSHTSGVEDQPDPAAWINSTDHVKYTDGPAMAAALRAVADRLDTLGDTELSRVWMSLSLQMIGWSDVDADQVANRASSVASLCRALGVEVALNAFHDNPDKVSWQNDSGNVRIFDHYERPSRDEVVDAEVVEPTPAIEAMPYVEHRKGMTGRNADGTVSGFCRCSKYFARFADHDALDAAIASHAELSAVSA